MSAEGRPSSWIWIMAGLGLLLLSGTLHRPLIEQREEQQLQTVPPEDTTPLVTLTTVAFGGFRGLVADALWVRASTLQEEGQYFEMVQLAQWITQLEPRAPKVWSFQAWNLAYNISALFPNHEDRWRWVTHGIDLLKKDGLTHNPTSASLYWNIGWMYQHKIGMDYDLGHLLYKRTLADQVEPLLPGGILPEDASDTETAQALSRILFMDVPVMAELEEAYGPLDWRLPESHSLYWATRGLEFRDDPFYRSKLRRMKRQSLLTLIRSAVLLRDEESGAMLTLPRLELIPLAAPLYRKEWETNPENQSNRSAYLNFLKEACMIYAEMGQIPKALEMYERIAEVEPAFQNTREGFQSFLQQILGQPPSELSRPQAMSRVVTLLILSGDPKLSPVRARGREQMARQAHRMYQESCLDEKHLERTGLPPFEVMQRMISTRKLWEDPLFPRL